MLHFHPQDPDQQEQPETEGFGERQQDRHCCLNYKLFCNRIKWQRWRIYLRQNFHRIRLHFHQSTLRENRKPKNGFFSMQELSRWGLSPRISTRPGSTARACLLGRDGRFPTHQKTCHKITIACSKLIMDVILIRNRKKYSLQKVSVEAHIELSIRVKS